MRYLNDKNYINRLMPIYDGTERVMMPVAPENVKRFSEATNGMQYAPSTVQNQNELKLFDDQLLNLISLESDGKVKDDFGKSGSGIQYKTYNAAATTQPGSLLTG